MTQLHQLDSTRRRRVTMLETALRPIVALLDDDSVIEIMLNADSTVWVEQTGSRMHQTEVTVTPEDAERAIRLLASEMATTVSPSNPSVAGSLPGWGYRIQASVPPIVSAPVFTIRKTPKLRYTLDDYVNNGAMSARHAQLLRAAVHARQNILIGGGTGSGKTTLANALLDAITQLAVEERLYIVEDNRELHCAARNRVEVFTTADYPMRRAIIDALRQRPDRIIIGEVRDGAALELLKAWNTGHPGGIATVHANSPRSMLERMCQLIEENNMPAPRAFVADAVQLCVYIAREPAIGAGRRVKSVARVAGVDAAGQWLLEELEAD